MDLNKDFEDLLVFLNQEGAEFLVVGAYAVMFYTEPRYTKDIDLWVKPEPENAEKVYKALKKFGAPIKNLTINDLTNRDMFYQIGIEPYRIDIIMDIGGLNFLSAWEKRERSSYGKAKIGILELKDLIKAKKAASRPQDLLDLAKLDRVLKKRKKKAARPPS